MENADPPSPLRSNLARARLLRRLFDVRRRLEPKSGERGKGGEEGRASCDCEPDAAAAAATASAVSFS